MALGTGWTEIVSLLMNLGAIVGGGLKLYNKLVVQYERIMAKIEEHDLKLDAVLSAMATSQTLSEAKDKVAAALERRRPMSPYGE